MVKKFPFDTVKSFEPIVETDVVPADAGRRPDDPGQERAGLVAYGKANPGRSPCVERIGGTSHVRRVVQEHGRPGLTHVPYKGRTSAHPDLRSGTMSLMFDTVAAIEPPVKAGS